MQLGHAPKQMESTPRWEETILDMHRRQCYPTEWAPDYLASGITIRRLDPSVFGRHVGPGTGQATLLGPEISADGLIFTQWWAGQPHC